MLIVCNISFVALTRASNAKFYDLLLTLIVKIENKGAYPNFAFIFDDEWNEA